MKYLLDTHIVLWIAEDSPRLSKTVREALTDTAAEKYVSVTSAWEVALKLGTGKLRLDGGLQKFFDIVDGYGFATLPVEREYLRQLPNLTAHHKDPFDRMLVATAITENMTLITDGQYIQKYNVSYLG
jgi:PIN domain nuclease of toxin-antitoxin system